MHNIIHCASKHDIARTYLRDPLLLKARAKLRKLRTNYSLNRKRVIIFVEKAGVVSRDDPKPSFNPNLLT